MFRKLIFNRTKPFLPSFKRRQWSIRRDILRDCHAGNGQNSTIFALSSGYGKCGVAVIRISGPEASTALKKMAKITNLEPRKAVLRKIRDPRTEEALDKGLCLWFPGPSSFTGEDSVEFHVHGGPAVISSLLQALSKLNFYLAAPGEFTKRAFFNGKLDLTEAEGIGDLIEAETEKQRKQASRQVDGSLRRLYDHWRQNLLMSFASLETFVDFSEENPVGSDIMRNTRLSLEKLSEEIRGHLMDGKRGEVLRNGIRMVIVGEPNAGKSSLLNILSKKDAAIVTSMPGTTRDIVEITIDVGGYPVILADTAGIRNNPENEAEVEGIRRARNCAEKANIVLCLVNGEKGMISIENYFSELGIVNDDDTRILVVVNKIDLIKQEEKELWKNREHVGISCKTKEGIEELTRRLGEDFKDLCGDPSEENPLISHERYRNHLSRCVEHVNSFLEQTEAENYDVAISLQEIRSAARELGKITGHIGNEEVLDIIFKNFCIGK